MPSPRFGSDSGPATGPRLAGDMRPATTGWRSAENQSEMMQLLGEEDQRRRRQSTDHPGDDHQSSQLPGQHAQLFEADLALGILSPTRRPGTRYGRSEGHLEGTRFWFGQQLRTAGTGLEQNGIPAARR